MCGVREEKDSERVEERKKQERKRERTLNDDTLVIKHIKVDLSEVELQKDKYLPVKKEKATILCLCLTKTISIYFFNETFPL